MSFNTRPAHARVDDEIRRRELQLQGSHLVPPVEKAKIEAELRALIHDRDTRRARETTEQHSFPVPRSPTRSLFTPASQRNNTMISNTKPHTNQLQGVQAHGFEAYANGQDGSFGDVSTPRGSALSGQFTQPGNPAWSFQGMVPGPGQRDNEQYNSGAQTPAESSSGSAATPSSIGSSPPVLHNAARQSNLKRCREPSGASPEVQKSRRPTPSFLESGTRTPSSQDSSDFADDIPDEVLAMLGGDPREEIRKIRRLEQEAAARRERERLDAEYAAQLTRELNGDASTLQPTRSFAGPSNPFRSSFQSTLNSQGNIRRPLSSSGNSGYSSAQSEPFRPAPSTQPYNQLSPSRNTHETAARLANGGSQDLSPTRTVKAESRHGVNSPYVHREPSAYAGSSRRLPLPPGFVDLGSSDSDDEIAVTDGTSFVPNNRRTGVGSGYGRREIAERPSTGSSIFSNMSNIPVTDLTGSSPMAQRFRDPALSQGIHGADGASVYGRAAPPPGLFSSIRSGISDAASRAYGILDTTLNAVPDATLGFGQPPMIDGRGLPGAWGPSLGSSYNPFDVDDDYYNRYHASMSADPGKTAEELRDLMNNIRPDEELGESDLTGSPDDMADGCGLYEHQKRGLAWMISMEDGSNKGGILADDMGLGKTIQAIALMVSKRSEDPRCKTTLIIAPVALLKQWENEIKVKVKPDRRLTTYIYHGSKKNTTWDTIRTFDVVLTTYGTLAAEMTRKDKIDLLKKTNPNWVPTTQADRLPLLGDECKFFRVILDEAQNIKNRNTKSATATYAVKAQRRFCMTGTPMMNSTSELFSLVHFLRIRPYCQWDRFNRDFVRPLRGESVTNTDEAMRKLQAFLKAILLRRTKKSEINGEPIIKLPERTTVIDHAMFDEEQLEFYKNLEKGAQQKFNRYVKAGSVGRNYSNALVLLLRLRQACCHPHLIRDFAEGGNGDLTPEQLEMSALNLNPDAVRRVKEEGLGECPICMDVVLNATIFIPCGHGTCPDCFTRISDPSPAVDDAPGGGDGAKTFKCMTCRGICDPRKVTDWISFKKVHVDDTGKATEEEDSQAEAETESESDSDSETESEDGGSDQDETLGGFIVNDDAEDEADIIKDEDEEDDDLDLDLPFQSAAKPSGEKSKVQKGKGPAQEEDKPKGKGKKSKKTKKDRKSRKAKGKKREKVAKIKSLSELQKEGKRNKKAKKEYLARLRAEYVTSSKIEKCMQLLDEIMAREGDEKTIVFSQFTTMLDLLEVPISDREWGYKRYDGGMSAVARNDAVLDFTSRRKYKIMLVSLKAGNSGLNLTAANNVIMFDPFWNPYIEEQAVDRAHRIGQRRPVHVHRLLVEETVEDRIIALQEKKRAMIEGALDENASRNIGRLGVRELAFLFGVSSTT